MSDTAALPLADTSDMARVHRVFRTALAAAPRLVGSVAPGDTDRAALVASYYDNVLKMLHAHHEGEDALMTPLLVERAPDEAETIERVAAQHDVVLTALTDAEARIAPWRDDPTPDTAAKLAAALAVLNAGLSMHLDEEEQFIVPIAARTMNVAEWGRLPEHSMQSFTGDKLWLVMGLVSEQMTEEQRAHVIANMPPPVRDFWLGAGQAMFNSFVAELRR